MDRFWSKVDRGEPDDCWTWTGSTDAQGYSTFWAGAERGRVNGHRIAYELAVGAIPAGLIIDHLCRNRACVNPAQGYQPTVLAAVAALGVAADLEQYRLPDGTISHVYEHVRQVVRGDWVQACHGDEGNWEQVDQAPIHAETQTGLPTRNLAGEVRLRWWGNEDLVRMAERPVPDPAAWRAEAGR